MIYTQSVAIFVFLGRVNTSGRVGSEVGVTKNQTKNQQKSQKTADVQMNSATFVFVFKTYL